MMSFEAERTTKGIEPYKAADLPAHRWLRAWGDVLHERAVTGDPSAIPKCESAEGFRGKPSNIADIEARYLDVERVLSKSPTVNGRRLCYELHLFVYRDGWRTDNDDHQSRIWVFDLSDFFSVSGHEEFGLGRVQYLKWVLRVWRTRIVRDLGLESIGRDMIARKHDFSVEKMEAPKL